ncbi:MAG: hypothetical protein ACI9L6_001406 [Flavobacterium sp.]
MHRWPMQKRTAATSQDLLFCDTKVLKNKDVILKKTAINQLNNNKQAKDVNAS